MDRREFMGKTAAVLAAMPWAGRVLAAADKQADSVAIGVSYDGPTPEPKVLDCGSDPICAKLFRKKPLLDETLVVGENGGLQNVLVQVAKGLPDRKWPIPETPVEVDQQCQFIPHVFAVMANQPLKFCNSATTLEVPHLFPRENKDQSFKLPEAASKIITLPKPEMSIRVKCDVHDWELAYCHVLTHPFYAITDQQGKCAIKGLEPGEYELAFWHEKLGTMTRRVVIESGKTAKLEGLSSKEFRKKRSKQAGAPR